MPEVVTCGICFKLLARPVTLSCRHTYCYECVRTRLVKNNDNGMLCVLCNTPDLNIHLSNLDDYVNAELEALIQGLRTGQYAGPTCQWCESQAATLQCNQCCSVYCEGCNGAVHLNAARRQHVVGPITDAYRSFFRKCNKPGHEAYKAEFYCTQCEELCCAYCLQVGPHKSHLNISCSSAAEEMRKRLPADVEALTQGKARLESQANEMNRTAAHYEDTYDAVENAITERFASFKQQLIQAELAARNALSSLRESGDVTLTGSRKSFLSKLNGIAYHLLVFQSLQHGGADYEILESRTQLDTCMKAAVAGVAGRGFDLKNTGEFKVEGLNIVLDLQAAKDPLQPFMGGRPDQRSASPLKITNYGTSPSPLSQQINLPLRLTFPVDEDVQATVQSDGVFLRCVARQRGGVQIGVRSRETFKDVMERYRKDDGRVSWRVRLGNVRDTFMGVVEKLHETSAAPEGFYWKPAAQGVVDGRIGTSTSNMNNLPVCRNGDVVRFLYDGNNRTLQVFLNETNCGVILNNVHASMSACFIFFPGETLTLLF